LLLNVSGQAAAFWEIKKNKKKHLLFFAPCQCVHFLRETDGGHKLPKSLTIQKKYQWDFDGYLLHSYVSMKCINVLL